MSPFPLRFIPALAWTTWVLFVAGLLALVYLAGLRETESRFLADLATARERLESRLIANALVLDGFAGLVAATPAGEPALLRRYAAEVLARHPHIFALEVARAVPAGALAAFEARMEQEHPGFRVRNFRFEDRHWDDVPAKPWYHPIIFMEPLRPGSEAVLGLDLDSVPFLAQALARSHAQGDFAASPPFRLVEGQLAYVLFRPVPQRPAGAQTVLLVVDLAGLVQPLAGGQRLPLSLTLRLAGSGETLFVRRAGETADPFARHLLPRLARDTTVTVACQSFLLQAERQLTWRDLPPTGLVAVAAGALTTLVLLLALLRIHGRLEAERRRAERRLAHLATHDPLTGLPNRVLLLDRFQQARQRAQREGRGFALLFLDLDGFKQINDRHGHHVGDLLLRTIAQRLRNVLRGSDTVARLSGDEFVILLEEAGTLTDLTHLTAKLRGVLAQPLPIEHGLIVPSASIGVARFPEDGADWDALLRAADSRMYAQKTAGRR